MTLSPDRGKQLDDLTCPAVRAAAGVCRVLTAMRARCALLAAIALVTASCGTTRTAVTCRGALELAYSEGSGRLVLLDARGHLLRRLTKPRAGWADDSPAWSLDGQEIAFARSWLPNPVAVDLYVVAATGGAPSLRQTGALAPSWSPRGDELLAERTNGHDFWWSLITPSGSRRAADLQDTEAAAWSSDGRLALARFEDVAVARSDGSRARPVWHGHADAPVWSSDGKRIAFVATTGPLTGYRPTAIWSVPAEGGTATRIFRGDHPSAPAWSPDGRRIAFSTVRDGGNVIDIVDADGRGHRVLERGGADAAWSPDGRWIAFDAEGGLYLVRPDGTEPHRIAAAGSFSWRPCAR